MREIIIRYEQHKNMSLMDALRLEGVQTEGTCGGMGTCGKCQVIANGVPVLACRHQVTEDLKVLVADGKEEVSLKEEGIILPDHFICDEAEPDTYGIAIDLGTTTVVIMLWDLARGSLVDVKAVSNPQKHYGADVMSRIGFTMRAPWNLTRLQSSLMNELNRVISDLIAKHGLKLAQIQKVSAVGNTVMSHLFLGEDVCGLGQYPFQQAFEGSVITTARQIGIAAHEEAEVYVGPNMAGHVGSDITAGVLAAGYMEGERDNRLFIDIGTNGEMLLTCGGKAWCCSTAAGPAFEGSALHQGMRGAEGAVFQVKIEEDEIKAETIGGKPAVGICGSGIIDALAVMMQCGAMDRFGGIAKNFVLTKETETLPAVVVTQQDVRQVQMAKAAIAAGTAELLQKAGLEVKDLKEIGIAGAFGNAIHVESGMAIGLLPETEVSRFRSLGNAAGVGASMLLLSSDCRKKAESIAAAAEHVELAVSTDFQNRYIEKMNF